MIRRLKRAAKRNLRRRRRWRMSARRLNELVRVSLPAMQSVLDAALDRPHPIWLRHFGELR